MLSDLLYRMRALLRRSSVEAELDEELRAHLERQTEKYIKAGLPPEEAARRARIDLGGVEQTKEECRDARGVRFLDPLWQDLRYGLRQLRRNPGFATVAITTLALGIGVTTVMFSVIDNVLLRPFPYKNASRYTTFYLQDLTRPGDLRGVFRIREFFHYREQNHVFQDMIGSWGTDVLYNSADGTREFRGAYVTTNTFRFLGVRPILGRGLTDEDGKPGSSPVFVMNYRLWESQFHGDRKLLGKPLTLNGKPRVLVGIMPPRFQYADASIWLPLKLSSTRAGAGGVNQPRFLVPVGLRKPGVSLQAAASDLNVIAKRLSKVLPRGYPKRFAVKTETLTDSAVGHLKDLLYILLAAVMMLLLIACSNVANLLLARATAREREIAVRAAVGASRGRLIRQMLIESFVLASVGGVLGWLLAYGALKGVVAAIPPDTIPASAVIALNLTVLWFAIGVTVLTTFLCGLAAALHAVGGNLDARLRNAGRGLNTGFLRGRAGESLVIAEVALSIVLLVGAGLMIRTFFALEHIDLGFNPKDILRAQLVVPHSRKYTAREQKVVLKQILHRVRALPGVTAASVTAALPPDGGPYGEVAIQGKTHSARWYAMFNLCSTGYFNTLNLPLIRGNLLSKGDVDSARFVAVINRAFARDFFGKGHPIGRRVEFALLNRRPDTPHNAWFEIIGVVGDAKNAGPKSSVAPEVFLPYTITT